MKIDVSKKSKSEEKVTLKSHPSENHEKNTVLQNSFLFGHFPKVYIKNTNLKIMVKKKKKEICINESTCWRNHLYRKMYTELT